MSDVKTPDKIVYTARATSEPGGRQGHAFSEDHVVDVKLDRPAEMGGPGDGATNPEQLFAVGYAACFNGAIALVAKKFGVDASQSTVNIEVGFGPEGESFGLTVEISASLPGVDPETAQKVVDATHQVCPYSKATRGNIPVTVKAV